MIRQDAILVRKAGISVFALRYDNLDQVWYHVVDLYSSLHVVGV